ncbi:MAG: hypothetical protein GY725_09360 [bacterium]|nr:hypothetical protein [bacterium]
MLNALQQSSRFAEAMPGNRVSQFFGLLQQSGFALMEGRLDDASRLIAEVFEQGRDCVSWAEVAQLAYRFVEFWESGKIDLSARDLMPFLEGLIAGFDGDVMLGHSCIAVVRSFCDDRHAAIVAIDSVLETDFARHQRNDNWISAAYFLANAIERHGTEAHAETLSAALEPFAEQIVCQPSARWAAGSVASTQGLLSSVLGDFETGIAQFDEGIAREKALGAKPAVLRSKAGLACLLARRRAKGDHRRAQDLMDEVLTGCKGLGIDPRQKYIAPFERLLQK